VESVFMAAKLSYLAQVLCIEGEMMKIRYWINLQTVCWVYFP